MVLWALCFRLTSFQSLILEEIDLKEHSIPLKGNNDLLSITQPQAIKEVHLTYLEAGADIIETNTFSGTTIAMADYEMEDLVYELNFESSKLAREAADYYTQKTPENLVLLLDLLDQLTKQLVCRQM